MHDNLSEQNLGEALKFRSIVYTTVISDDHWINPFVKFVKMDIGNFLFSALG